MEMIGTVINNLWTSLNTTYVPVLNIPFTHFFISILILIIFIKLLHYLLGTNHADGKSE